MLKNNAVYRPFNPYTTRTFIRYLSTRLSTPMDQRRVELLTPALSERCSNQLSYWSSNKKLRRERYFSLAQFPSKLQAIGASHSP